MSEQLYACFRGWKLPNGRPSIAGPFVVRVWRDKSHKPIRIRAEVLPTRQVIRGKMFDTCSEMGLMQGMVASMFDTKVTDWTEQKLIT